MRTIACLAMLLVSLMTVADELPIFSSLCVATGATGFSLEKGKWVQRNFKTEQFVVKKVTVPKEPETDRANWVIKYFKCRKQLDEEPVISDSLEVHHSCVQKNTVGEDTWRSLRCKEYLYKRKGDSKKPVFYCEGINSKLNFYPDGNYIYTFSHGKIGDGVQSADDHVMEMGRCSVITE